MNKREMGGMEKLLWIAIFFVWGAVILWSENREIAAQKLERSYVERQP